MNVLDENIAIGQKLILRRWRIAVRQIGYDLGRKGMKDEGEIIPLLHCLRRPTFFTRDFDFCRPRLCHPRYCLVLLDIWPQEVARYVRRFLRHRQVKTQAQRMGCVVAVSPGGIRVWRHLAPEETFWPWEDE